MKSVNEELRDAAAEGDEAGLKALLLLPTCDPMSKDYAGRTALMQAAAHGQSSCVELLLPVSDASAKDNEGLTALMWAAFHGNFSCVELLLPASDALAKDEKGMTAGDHARDGGHSSLAALMDAYALAMSEGEALRSSTGPGATRKSAPLRV